MGGPDGASKSLDFNESTFLAIKKIEWREGLLMLQAFKGLSFHVPQVAGPQLCSGCPKKVSDDLLQSGQET